ncbi:PilZ domain-containing protein [Labrenzia sp. CE80]|uniref:PilZ domain-containing protein n=1 Tax=Labrenzia sp. CE80 TaxID=1788986 RepID=UPI00129AE314|nr:PilZ domain-containing protein [Labrenzia sp. CE80]
MTNGLEHLQDQPDAKVDVLAIDFDNLTCVKAILSNVSQWGCSLTSEDANDLRKNIGIRVEEKSKLIRGTVTAVKGDVASVIFPKQETVVQDKRRERRNQVSIPVTISDRGGVTEISGVIVDAGQNGCRVSAQGLTSLPEDVVLNLKNFEKPVLGEFAWRNGSFAGLRLLWDAQESIG